eukprot:Clim_evm131s157 gene=Clim_evmTU131s157
MSLPVHRGKKPPENDLIAQLMDISNNMSGRFLVRMGVLFLVGIVVCFFIFVGGDSRTQREKWVQRLKTVESKQAGQMRTNIILSTDREQLPGVVGTMRSSFNHTTTEVHYNILIADDSSEEDLWTTFRCWDATEEEIDMFKRRSEIIIFDSEFLDGKFRVAPDDGISNLSSVANFVRFYFAEFFPDLDYGIYMDVDVLVLADIRQVWDALTSTDKTFVAVERAKTFGWNIAPVVYQIYEDRYGTKYQADQKAFNAGVFGVNLKQYRKKKLTSEAEFWMQANAETGNLWQFGTQPVQLLISHGDWVKVDPCWNVDGLGHGKRITFSALEKACLMHWTGKKKPWFKETRMKSLYNAEVGTMCNGLGQCRTLVNSERAAKNQDLCFCDNGSTGTSCY